MKLLIQPGSGVDPLIAAIGKAKQSIEVVIFRFDHRGVEAALAACRERGVEVQALIASINRGGEDSLRKLEMRLLGAGVTVARTSDDLVRYHAKLMIIDRRELCLMAFNFTHLDIDRSRSFGVVTTNRRLVQEAAKLFEADAKRQPYKPEVDQFIVSPENARKQLAAFLKGAKKELLIYDPEISDPAMARILEERLKAGVEIRVIGRVARQLSKIPTRRQPGIRLHTRTMIRDRKYAFIGSQSLRRIELDDRREVDHIQDPKVVSALIDTFHSDWESTETAPPPAKIAKEVAKAVADDLPPMAPMVAGAMKQMTGGSNGAGALDDEKVEETVKGAVKEAVKDLVKDAVEQQR